MNRGRTHKYIYNLHVRNKACHHCIFIFSMAQKATHTSNIKPHTSNEHASYNHAASPLDQRDRGSQCNLSDLMLLIILVGSRFCGRGSGASSSWIPCRVELLMPQLVQLLMWHLEVSLARDYIVPRAQDARRIGERRESVRASHASLAPGSRLRSCIGLSVALAQGKLRHVRHFPGSFAEHFGDHFMCIFLGNCLGNFLGNF